MIAFSWGAIASVHPTNRSVAIPTIFAVRAPAESSDLESRGTAQPISSRIAGRAEIAYQECSTVSVARAAKKARSGASIPKASNTAVAAVFLPILKDAAIAAEADPRLLMVPAALAASCGFMLPIATPPNTIVFASGKVSVGQMVKAGFVLDVMSIGLLVLALWFWGLPLLGVDPDVVPEWVPK